MKHLKTYEENKIHIGIEKGDTVVFSENVQSRLKYGESYIVNSVCYIYGDDIPKDILEKEKVEYDSDFITVIDNGEIVLNSEGEPMIFYAYRFVPEIYFNQNKYNL